MHRAICFSWVAPRPHRSPTSGALVPAERCSGRNLLSVYWSWTSMVGCSPRPADVSSGPVCAGVAPVSSLPGGSRDESVIRVGPVHWIVPLRRQRASVSGAPPPGMSDHGWWPGESPSPGWQGSVKIVLAARRDAGPDGAGPRPEPSDRRLPGDFPRERGCSQPDAESLGLNLNRTVHEHQGMSALEPTESERILHQ